MSDQVMARTAERIAAGGRAALSARLHAAFEEEVRIAGLGVGANQLGTLVAAAADQADAVLWRRALADAACAELGVTLPEAVIHPAVERAQEMVGAPPWSPLGERRPARAGSSEEERQALRLAAVHLGGIETVRPGDRDIELRLSAAGLDVLKRSTGAVIGRLTWPEIQTIELSRARRRLRPGRRRVQELHVATERGQASFKLPGLTEEQMHGHLEPMLDRQGVARTPS